MQLGEIDRSKSPASVRAAASRVNPLDPEVQAIQNIPILIAQYNIEIGHYEELTEQLLESTPQTRQAIGPKAVELGQRLEIVYQRLGGLRERLAEDIRAAFSAGYLTFDEAAATGAIGAGVGFLPLIILAVGFGVAAIVYAAQLGRADYVVRVAPVQAELARVQALRKWMDQEIDASNAATSAGGEYKPQIGRAHV